MVDDGAIDRLGQRVEVVGLPVIAPTERLAGDPALKAYHLLPSVRGDLLLKLGRRAEARAAFEAALALAENGAERDLLRRRAAEAAP